MYAFTSINSEMFPGALGTWDCYVHLLYPAGKIGERARRAKQKRKIIKLMPPIIFKINSKWTLDILEWINYLREQCVKIECQGERQGRMDVVKGSLRQGDHRVVSGVETALTRVVPRHTLMARQEANTIGFMHCGSLAHSLQYLVSRFLSTSPFSGKKKKCGLLFYFKMPKIV